MIKILKKNMKDFLFLFTVLIFSLVSYLVLKVSEGLCTKTKTCNQCNNCKKKRTHWGWPTFF